MSSEFQSDEVQTESSWAGPARILIITLILAGGFAYYYFGPSVEDLQGNSPRSSTSREPVTVSVAGETFAIPQNYTQFTRTRRGGAQDTVDLYAVLPDFEGFTIARQEEFEGNSESSPVVHITLQDLHAPASRRGDKILTQRMTEREKFERIFLPFTVDPKGESARYGFTRYRLTEAWGGADEDLFVHEASNGGIILYRCLQNVPSMPSPWCRRDTMLTERLVLSYRFKRSRLSEWRDIDTNVTQLIDKFRNAAPQPRSNNPPPGSTSEPTPPEAASSPGLTEPTPPAAEQQLVPSEPGPTPQVPESAPAPPAERSHRRDPNADPDTEEDIVPEQEIAPPSGEAPG